LTSDFSDINLGKKLFNEAKLNEKILITILKDCFFWQGRLTWAQLIFQ